MEISFIIENATSGESVTAESKLQFQSEVMGNHQTPYVLDISETSTGIDQFDSDGPVTVYTLDGVLVSGDATLKSLRRLPKGVYIIRSANGRPQDKNGKKRFVK